MSLASGGDGGGGGGANNSGVRLAGLGPAEWNARVAGYLSGALGRVNELTAGGDGDQDDGNPLPTLSLIAHSSSLLGPFLGWASALALEGALERRHAEIVALRTAFDCRSWFEWREHRIHARSAGLTDAEIDRIAVSGSAEGWTALEGALVAAADQLHHDATIAEATWATLRAELNPAQLVEIMLISGQYRMLSALANAAGVDAGLDTAAAPWSVGDTTSAVAPEPDLLGLQDAVAIVTGGARSIGRGCAIQLARAGCHVVIVDLADGTDAVEEIESIGRKGMCLRVDARSRSEMAQMLGHVIERFGRLDVAVNTVGSTMGPKPFLDLEQSDWDEVMHQNLSTALLATQLEALTMIEHGSQGRIINVSSLSGVAGAPNAAGYGAANAGVLHLTASAALELAQYGIRVNCIVPGTHLTETTKKALDGDDVQLAEWVRVASRAAPLGHLGEPWETGGVAVFLASRLSAYVTGQGIISDGGLVHTTARPPIGMVMQPAAVARLNRPANRSPAS